MTSPARSTPGRLEGDAASADRLYRARRARRGRGDGDPAVPETVFPVDREYPTMTVFDAHLHTPASLAAVNRVPSVNLGVTDFGQTGIVQHAYHERRCDRTTALGDRIQAQR